MNSLLKVYYSKLLYLKIEALKILVALVSILTFIFIGKFFGSEYLVLFAYLQALIIIVSSLYDQGLNVTNLDVKIKGQLFVRFKVSKIQQLISLMFFIIIFIYIFYINSYELSFNFILSMIICTPFNVYLMRWNTVLKRQGLLQKQIVFGELVPAIIRSICVLVGFLDNEIIFIYFVSFAPIVAALICSQKNNVDNLFILKASVSTGIKEQNVADYLLSIFISLKNQMLGLIIPILPMHLQGSFVVISRVYGLTLIATSGLFSRVPISIFKYQKGTWKNDLIFIYLLICFILISMVSTFVIWLPIVGNIFSIEILSNNTELFLLVLVMFGIFIGLNSLILQVLAKVKFALLLEVSYVVLFFIGVVYVQLYG
jgi:hypothetical protein